MRSFGESELLIALVQAFGGARPTSNGIGELQSALIDAITGGGEIGVSSFNTRTGAVVLVVGDVEALFTAAGQIIVGTGTGTGELLAPGTSGNVLTVGGADPSGLEWIAPPVTLTNTVTLTNKTLTAPAVTSMTGTSTNLTPINNVVTVTSNAGTVPVTSKLSTFTNSSAATMAITITTAGATDGQPLIVRVYDFSAVAQTIGWTNTENSSVSVPTTSNGSTTAPLTIGFMFNAATTKWRCVAVA